MQNRPRLVKLHIKKTDPLHPVPNILRFVSS